MMPTAPTRREPSIGLQLGLLALAATFVVIQAIGSMWSGSVDLAHHYALVARLAEYWSLPAGVDPSLMEMSVYPRTSHGMAAIVGTVFNSPLIGMQLVGLLSIVVVWASFIYLLHSLPGKLATRGLLVFVGLLVLNRVELRFEIHGRELVESYFFSQLVAQAVVALSLVALLAMERRQVESVTRYAVCVAILYFCVGIHLLPALELLGSFLLLVTIDFLVRAMDGAQGRLRSGAIALALMLGAIALLVRHPAFSAMAEISRNNGALAPKHLNSIAAITAYATLIAIMSVVIVRQWFVSRHGDMARGLLVLKYLGAYGLAVAGLCLVQVLALKFGQGSEYAVKKHVFALNTVMLLELSLVPALLATRAGRSVSSDASENSGFVFRYLLLPLLTVLAFYAIAPRKHASDTAQVVALERALQKNRDALVGDTPGKFAYVLPGPGVPPPLAYMLTIGILKSPRGHGSNSFSILQGQPLVDWSVVGTIVQPGQVPSAQASGCLRPFPGAPFSVLDGECVQRAAKQPATLVRFVAGSVPSPCILTGFGAPEAMFTWTTQARATIECPVPEIAGQPATRMILSAGAFLDHVPFQRARVSVEGGATVDLRFDQAKPFQSLALDLPAGCSRRCRVVLELPDSISPKDVGVSVDPRQLGLRVERIEFQ